MFSFPLTHSGLNAFLVCIPILYACVSQTGINGHTDRERVYITSSIKLVRVHGFSVF